MTLTPEPKQMTELDAIKADLVELEIALLDLNSVEKACEIAMERASKTKWKLWNHQLRIKAMIQKAKKRIVEIVTQ